MLDNSDKSFDLLGAAKVIECVKDLIISIWDRIIFHKEKKMHEKLDLIGKSLPLLEKISLLEEEKRLSPEKCELLRRGILGGSEKFIRAGAILPEFEEKSKFNPRRLMTPEKRLLTSGEVNKEVQNISNEKEEKNEDELNFEKLTDLTHPSNEKEKKA